MAVYASLANTYPLALSREEAIEVDCFGSINLEAPASPTNPRDEMCRTMDFDGGSELDEMLCRTMELDSEGEFDVGSIEVEAERNKKGKVVISRIVFLPRESSIEPPVVVDNPAGSTLTDEDTNAAETTITIPEEETILDTIVNAFLVPCGDFEFMPQAGSKPIKSALRKSHDDVSVGSRSVSFSSLAIREYNMTLGDHPSAKSGPPISLSWDYAPEPKIVDLDSYERARRPRRSRKSLKLSMRDREQILLKDRGFSVDEVKEAWMAALEVRKQRYETLSRSPFTEKMDEVWESASRKLKRLFSYETA